MVRQQPLGAGRHDRGTGQDHRIIASGKFVILDADFLQPLPCSDKIGGGERAARAEPIENFVKHQLRLRLDGLAPRRIGLGRVEDRRHRQRLVDRVNGLVLDQRSCRAQPLDGAFKPGTGFVARLAQPVLQDQEPAAGKRCPGQIGAARSALEGGEKQRGILDIATQRADGIEAGHQRHHTLEREPPRGGFEPDKIVPRGGNAHRPAGIGADPACRQPKGHGRGSTGRRAARHRVGVIHARRGFGHRVQPKAGEGKFRHMGLAKADQPHRAGIGDHLGIGVGHPAPEHRRTRLGGGAGSVEQVFPAHRHTVERSAPGAGSGALGGSPRLGHGALFRQSGKDPVAQRMRLDRVEMGQCQIDRIDLARSDPAPKVARAHPQPVVRHRRLRLGRRYRRT